MKRGCLLVAFLAAGCAREQAPSPRRVRVRVTVESGFEERHRSALERILGGPSRTLSQMMEDAAGSELAAKGFEVIPEGAAVVEGELEVSLGRWNLDSVPSSNVAAVAFTLTLRRAGATEAVWSCEVPSRSVSLRPGEARDFSAFTQRLVREAMRGCPDP